VPTTAVPTTAVPTVPSTTGSPQEQNAVQAAQQYLSIGSGFSRSGLIQQLSSSAGSGFPLGIATTAVDSLHVNWNAQAVLAAKAYLKTSAFSCSGLVQQLDSSVVRRTTDISLLRRALVVPLSGEYCYNPSRGGRINTR